MSKRKASVDRNVNQKAPARRPSASSLRARMQQMQPKAEKSPSTQNLPCVGQTAAVTNTTDTCLPKTRFTSQDRCRDLRSCSSPRLKYFPAEKIKKLETPSPFFPDPIGAVIVQQNPREAGNLYVTRASDQSQNNGQGDAAAIAQPLQQHRQHQSMHTVSQQQVVPQRAIHQIGETSPNSACTLPQQVINGQVHRPFVPHGSYEYPPQNNTYDPHLPFRGPTQTATASQPFVQQSASNVGPVSDQERTKPEENSTECPDYDKQPVGGRNATLYRQLVTNNRPGHQQSQASVVSNAANPSNSNHQPQPSVQNHTYVSPFANAPNPQQVYQQMQQTMAQQQQMQQRAMQYQMRMMNNQQAIQAIPGTPNYYKNHQYSAQRMTSPQDATTNQLKTSRTMGQVQQNYPVHQRDLDYAMNPQNGWARNNQVAEYSSVKAQLKPFSVDVIDGNQPYFGAQNQQQQLAPRYQSAPQHQQLYRNPAQGNATIQSQQNSMAYSQPGFNQQALQPNPQPVAENPVAQNVKPKLPFTAGMIRDQEKLVATMKQQRIPVDVMRRQFETLLSEQRKQLEYIQEIRRQDEAGEVKRPVATARRRTPIDEKPEWMIHLTPPRLSYMELEKMHEEQKQKERQQLEETQQQPNETSNMQVPVQLVNQQQNQFYQHINSQPYNNMYDQPNTAPRNTGKPNPNSPTMNYQYYPYQQNVPNYQYVQYPHQQQQQSQFQQYQQIYQNNPQQNQTQVHSANDPSMHQENKPTTEPSSLLKMRLYKEQIRPQKRNNGLQDPQVLRKQLENIHTSADVKKELDYLSNLVSRKPPVRLNGIQDRTEIEEELRERLIMSSYEPSPRKASANGLENTRNPNNPATQRFSNANKVEHDFMREYPRQKLSNPRNCYSVQAERENGTVAVDQQTSAVQQQLPGHNVANVIPYNEKNPMASRGNVMPFRFESTHPLHYQQMQQYYQNTRNLARNNGEGDIGSAQRSDVKSKGSFDRAGGDAYVNLNGQMDGQMAEGKMSFQGMHYSQPDIHEARTIGGVRYLARKQDYIPNTQFVSPETLITSRHLQAPTMY
ncbi:TPR-containing protein DDB_G0280363-like [Colletes gigas]|uniref:TPR-containing protein DDB_G0280363-like n=1 Tax=Colletes gigas TaxID=935657 RepID=UPI001C9AB3B1|nr:TPR-containing protein DDB_G0280363-like [Colletes gigas]